MMEKSGETRLLSHNRKPSTFGKFFPLRIDIESLKNQPGNHSSTQFANVVDP